jgi:biopolymer transport protein ExbD
MALATAQAAPPEPRVQIRVAKSRACYVAEVRVPCKAIVAKLNDMQINPTDWIKVMGDTHVASKIVSEVVDSLESAGYSRVIAFYEK